MSLLPLAFAPIFLVFVALVIGFIVTVFAGARRVKEGETASEGGDRGRPEAEARAAIEQLGRSLDEKADFLVKMGFAEIVHLADDAFAHTDAFKARNPMPMVGGTYLVHFLGSEAFDGEPVPSSRVKEFRRAVKHEEGVMKGILVTPNLYTEEAWGAVESAPLELIDGRHLGALLKMFYPDRFPPERV